MRQRRNVFLAVLMTVMMVVLAACGQQPSTGAEPGSQTQQPGQQQAGPVKVGILMPLTGDLGSLGGAMADAAKLAVKQVNAAGGVLGQQVEPVVRDTQTDSGAARDAMDQLVNIDRVAAVVGAAGSPMSIAALQVAEAAKVPMVSPSSTSPTLSLPETDKGNWFMRTPPTDEVQSAVMAQLVLGEGKKRAAVLALNNDYGQGFAQFFKQHYEAKGGQVVAEVLYDPKGTTFTSEVGKVAQANPEAVILIGYPDTGSVILREAYQAGMLQSTTWLMSEGLQSDDLATMVGKGSDGKFIVEGLRGTRPQAAGPLADTFKKDFEAEYGKAPAGPFDAHTWDAAALVLLAIEKAGSLDGTKIRDAILAVSAPPGTKVTDLAEALKLVRAGQDIDFDGASGTLNMNEIGDVLSDYEVWQVGADGKTQIVGAVSPE